VSALVIARPRLRPPLGPRTRVHLSSYDHPR
jgi:hypothetical protein